MKVRISDSRIPESDHGEIKHLLQQVAVGEGAGRWPDLPDEVDIRRRLTGGKSGSEVFEAIVHRGNNRQRKVIKLGPLYDLHDEYAAFKNYLNPPPSKFFVPIEAVSERLLSNDAPELSREVVIYNHAAEYQGATDSVTRTFEELAREAVRSDESLGDGIRALDKLFKGIRSGLHGRWVEIEQLRSHRTAWNWRLGFDATVTVAEIVASRKRLKTGTGSTLLYPSDVADRAVSLKPAADTERIQLANATVKWWGDSLIAETAEPHFLRVQIESGVSGATNRHLAKEVVNGEGWQIEATVTSWRQPKNRDRLLSLLTGFQLADGRLTGDGVSVRDPFPGLADVLNRERDDRVICVAHGDLNPRNILLVGGDPCLIDYAFTREGLPLMSDFVRLEGCLLREALADFTWPEHVRLQRLLALACRLGDDGAAERLGNRLTGERAELGRAFRLLWAVRRAARNAAPEPLRPWWDQDYLEQLFLFGHLMLKWLRDGDHQAAIVTAAIIGVAAEAIVPDRLFAEWSDADLRRDAELILLLLQSRAERQLATLASLARRLSRLGLKPDDPLWRDFRAVRQQLVRRRFAAAGRIICDNLEKDHDVFIHLKAFIDLKGQLKEAAKGRSTASTVEEMLESDDALNERERLRPTEDRPGDDALLLIANQTAAVLLGDAGAGKSTIAREWEYRLAKAMLADDAEKIEPRLPLVVRASEIAGQLGGWKTDAPTTETVRVVERACPLAKQVAQESADGDGERRTLRNLFEAGAASLVVDALNELADADKLRVAEWILAFREAFPLTPLLACHRQYNYPAGLLPFPIVTLQKVAKEQAQRYIRDYLRERLDGEKGDTVPDALAAKLIGLLLDSPDHEQVRDLAQTPLFLWMIVERYRQTQVLPSNRARLFDDFSRWYLDERHHTEHAEPPAARHAYEAKADLLGRLGHELVQCRATELALTDAEGVLCGLDPTILDEIVTAEMLHRENDKLRFLHQSFQEYFAARHLLTHLAQNPVEIQTRVYQFGWHDTFVLVLGFGGDNPEVVRQVVETALAVNPRLTARCLRMAETDDRSLLERFVAAQRAVLVDHNAGQWAHDDAAAALAEYGRGPARAALWEVVTSSTAPETARVQTLQQLAGLPEQVRMETVADKLRREFVERLPAVFDKPAPTTVQQAAIGVINKVKLKDLSGYLIDLVTSGEWPLRRAAWQACEQLGLQRTPGQRKTYVRACADQLDAVEQALYAASVVAHMGELNDERLAILEQLATPDNLPLLLRRRFAFVVDRWSHRWNERVATLLDGCVSQHATGTNVEPAAQVAWSVLRDEAADVSAATGHWLAMFVGDDELASLAAAHRLVKCAKDVPVEEIRKLLERGTAFQAVTQPGEPTPNEDAKPGENSEESQAGSPCYAWSRTGLFWSALARIVVTTKDQSLVEPLDQLLRAWIDRVTGREQVEAFANLVTALCQLDPRRGNRTAVVADKVFWTQRSADTNARQFPWRQLSSSISLKPEDYEALLSAGESDARAAVYQLQAYGGGITVDAEQNGSPVKLSAETQQRFRTRAEAEQDAAWQTHFASAAVQCHAVTLLDWLVHTATAPELAERGSRMFVSTHGLIVERYLADFLRSIGYLTRRLLNDNQLAAAQPGIDALRRYQAAWLPVTDDSIPSLQTPAPSSDSEPDAAPHRSIIRGLVTALGYLGDWEPLLTQLGPDEPWLHKAAQNVFKYWVPGPLSGSRGGSETGLTAPPVDAERERAALWIVQRLRRTDLPAEVRSTLLTIKADLEQKLGRHILTST